jgi:hypothetical protein
MTKPTRPGGGSYLIETRGSRIRVTLNGTLVKDYASTRNTSGFLALQVHSSTIQYRNRPGPRSVPPSPRCAPR